MLKNKHVEIKYKPRQKAYEVAIKVTDFPRKREKLSENNTFFSTYHVDSTIDGFVRLEEGFYLCCAVIHKLGAIVKIHDDIRDKQLMKVKLSCSQKQIILTVFPNRLKERALQYLDQRFYLKAPLLEDLYLHVTFATNEAIIRKKWDEQATPNTAALLKDYAQSDQNRLSWSPNTDGERRKNELFAGTGSNIGRPARR